MPDPQPDPKADPKDETRGGPYVCNVDTWGSGPTYHQGDLIPEDCPYDVDKAAKQKRILTVDDYKKAHPDWDPEAEVKAQVETEALELIYPGREMPTAADPPDPVATQQMYADAEAEAAGPAPKAGSGTAKPEPDPGQPVQVAPPSGPARTSGGSTSSRS